MRSYAELGRHHPDLVDVLGLAVKALKLRYCLPWAVLGIAAGCADSPPQCPGGHCGDAGIDALGDLALQEAPPPDFGPDDLATPDMHRPAPGTWVLQTFPQVGFLSVWAASSNAIFVGGVDGSGAKCAPAPVVFHSQDDGAHWAVEFPANPSRGAVDALWGLGAEGAIVFAGWGGGQGPHNLLRTLDGGQHWQDKSPSIMIDNAGHWANLFEKNGVLYGAGILPATVVLSADKGDTWVATPTPPPTNLDLWSVWVADSGRILIGLTNGVFYSDDGGRHWIPTAVPWIPAFNPHVHVRIWGFGKDVWAGGVADGNVGGFLAHSADEGTTWSNQASGVGNEITGIWGTSADDVYAVTLETVSGGQVIHTTDRGAHWKIEVADPDPATGLGGVFGVDGEVFAVGGRQSCAKGVGVIYHRY